MARKRPQAELVKRVYAHLLGAVIAFVALETLLFQTGLAQRIARAMLAVPWLLILSAFVLLGWLVRGQAYRVRSLAGQYAALAVYVVAKALLFVPLLYLAFEHAPGAVESAAVASLGGVAGLTWIAFSTRRDLASLRPLLQWGGWTALLLIVAALWFGWRLGVWFSVAMIGLSGVSILYDTSRVLRRCRSGRHVVAALELFASIALMFWYALRLFRRLGHARG